MECVVVLVAGGADEGAVDAEGNTAWELAVGRGREGDVARVKQW